MSCFSLSIYIYREDINSRKKAHSKRITILQAILRRSKINHIKLRDTQEAKTPILYLNTFSNEGQKVFEAARAIGYPPFTLAASHMALWNSPTVFKNAEPFIGDADEYLQLLVEKIVSAAEKETPCNFTLAWSRMVFAGRAVCLVCRVPDRLVLPCGQHVRLPMVSRDEGVCFFS